MLRIGKPWRRRSASLLVLVGTICAAALSVSRVAASVVVPMTLGQLVEAADVIIDGPVEDIRGLAGPDGAERLVLVRGGDAWKGHTDGPVYVRLAGGRIGAIETRVPGVPDVAEGERFVWFLGRHPRGGYHVIGLYQGALRAMPGPDGAMRVVVPGLTAGPRGDVARSPRLISALASQVRSLLAGAPQ